MLQQEDRGEWQIKKPLSLTANQSVPDLKTELLITSILEAYMYYPTPQNSKLYHPFGKGLLKTM